MFYIYKGKNDNFALELVSSFTKQNDVSVLTQVLHKESHLNDGLRKFRIERMSAVFHFRGRDQMFCDGKPFEWKKNWGGVMGLKY